MSDHQPKILNIQLNHLGQPTAHAYLTESSDTQRCEVRIKDRVVPILFSPGIMGSNLKCRDVWSGRKTPVLLTDAEELAKTEVDNSWQPPTSLGEMVCTLFTSIFRTKEMRRREMNPDVAFVDWDSNKIRPLPKKMTYIERENNKTEQQDEQNKEEAQKSAKKPFQEKEEMKESQKIAQEAKRRGWGTVYQGSYTPFLAFLEDTLNTIPAYESLDEYEKLASSGVWQSLLPLFNPQSSQSTPQEQVSDSTSEAQTAQDTKQLAQWLQKAADCEFRVYACGYNWLRDNQESGNGYDVESIEYFEADKKTNKKYGHSDLKSRIQKILEESKKTDSKCDEVIILTHSMGGLVGRAYAKEQNGQHLAGIYHNVMPATGAPAFYKRLKAGFGGEGGFKGDVVSLVFGYSAKRVTPVLLNSAGAMELMPWMDYQVLSDKTNNWLKIVEESNPEKIKFQLNTEDLMRNPQAWYSLLPDLYDHQGELMYQQTKLNDKKNKWEKADPRINPGGLVSPIKEFQEMNDSVRFSVIMEKVDVFQKKHMGFYQPGKTNIAYGDDGQHKAWGSISWMCSGSLDDVSEDELRQARLLKSNNMYKGKITLELPDKRRLSFKLSKAQDRGDGTVPTDSGCAPQGKTDGRIFIESGYEHQDSYADGSPSRVSALFSILEFASRKE